MHINWATQINSRNPGRGRDSDSRAASCGGGEAKQEQEVTSESSDGILEEKNVNLTWTDLTPGAQTNLTPTSTTSRGGQQDDMTDQQHVSAMTWDGTGARKDDRGQDGPDDGEQMKESRQESSLGHHRDPLAELISTTIGDIMLDTVAESS